MHYFSVAGERINHSRAYNELSALQYSQQSIPARFCDCDARSDLYLNSRSDTVCRVCAAYLPFYISVDRSYGGVMPNNDCPLSGCTALAICTGGIDGGKLEGVTPYCI